LLDVVFNLLDELLDLSLGANFTIEVLISLLKISKVHLDSVKAFQIRLDLVASDLNIDRNVAITHVLLDVIGFISAVKCLIQLVLQINRSLFQVIDVNL